MLYHSTGRFRRKYGTSPGGRSGDKRPLSGLCCRCVTKANSSLSIPMIYVLAYPEFEPPDADRIHVFRAKHEPQRAKLVPPHLTLVFGVKSLHLSVVTELAGSVSRQTHAFHITFDDHVIEFDPFEQKHKIFLLCGEGSCNVRALHSQLYDGEHRTELSTSHPFRPHMTIATCDTRAQIEQVNVSDAGTLPLRGTLRSLEVVQLSSGALSTLKTLPFRQ